MLEKLKIAAIAAGVAFAPMAANALVVTHTFGGEVIFDQPGADSTLFKVGDAAEVVLQYDSAAPGGPSGSLTDYAIDNISIRFGDYVATTKTGVIRVGDNDPLFAGGFIDLIYVQTNNLDGPAIAGEFYESFSFEFEYATDTFSGEALPAFLPPISSTIFNSENGALFNGGPSPAFMRVDTITTVVGATVVPLPAALPLFLSAFGCLALIRVRRKTAGVRGHVNGHV